MEGLLAADRGALARSIDVDQRGARLNFIARGDQNLGNMTFDQRLNLHRLPGPQDAHVLGGVAQGDRFDGLDCTGIGGGPAGVRPRGPALSARGGRQKEANSEGGGRIFVIDKQARTWSRLRSSQGPGGPRCYCPAADETVQGGGGDRRARPCPHR